MIKVCDGLVRMYLTFGSHTHLPECFWITDPHPHSRVPKKNTSHENEVPPQDTTHLTQRPCYQRGSPCQDPAGNWTTRRPPDERKETQTAVVYGRVSRSSGLAKTILQGTVKGGRRQSRQKRRGIDIREWTGLTSQRRYHFVWKPGVKPDNRQTWTSRSPEWQWRTQRKNGRNWLWSYLWYPKDPRGYLIFSNFNFFLYNYCLNGISPIGNSGCFPRGKLAATESRYPTYCACWAFP